MTKLIVDCLSDTHSTHQLLKFPKPDLEEGDTWVLVHAGDFSYYGSHSEVRSFAKWLEKQPHHKKVVIAGNHERGCDPEWVKRCHYLAEDPLTPEHHRGPLREIKTVKITGMLGKFCYLDQSSVTISGIKFWGSPYSLKFFDWGYQLDPKDAKDHWKQIPIDTDIVITHGPAKYHGDRCPALNDPSRMVFVGDQDLLDRLEYVKPITHISGHIHEGRGYYPNTKAGLLVNASSVTARYEPIRSFPRLVIDVEKKKLISYGDIICPSK